MGFRKSHGFLGCCSRLKEKCVYNKNTRHQNKKCLDGEREKCAGEKCGGMQSWANLFVEALGKEKSIMWGGTQDKDLVKENRTQFRKCKPRCGICCTYENSV